MDRKRNIDKFFWRYSSFSIITSSTSSAKFSKLDSQKVILFQIKVFGRNIEETTQERYPLKVTARPSFTRLKFIRRINRVH